MYSALIIDDESDARSVLKRMLELFCPEIKSVAEAKTAEEALERASTRSYDLIFIDIKLRRSNGLELAKQLIHYCPNLIFVTAHEDYGAQAFRTEAIDYLLKPVNPEHLQKAVARAQLQPGKPASSKDRILLVTKIGIRVVMQEDILRVQGDGNYCTFFCKNDEQYFISKNLSHYESLLDRDRFYRVHQSHLVNLAAVRQYYTEDGTHYAVMQDDDRIPIARRRREGFLLALKAYQS